MIQAFEVPLMSSIGLACLTHRANLNATTAFVKGPDFLGPVSTAAVFLPLVYNEKDVVVSKNPITSC